MLYVPFIAEFFFKQIAIMGPQICFRGGQRSMVKDHTFTFIWDPSLSQKKINLKKKVWKKSKVNIQTLI